MILTTSGPSVSGGHNLDNNILTTTEPSVSGGQNRDNNILTTIEPSVSGGQNHTRPTFHTDMWDWVSLNLDSLFKENSERQQMAKRGHASNPTGNIWDQATLNLNTLFETKCGNNFKVGIWNAESVRNKENQIKMYITDNDLDILIIQESWLDLDELPSTIEVLPSIDGFRLHQVPRSGRKHSAGGGMLCVFKQNIKLEKMPTPSTKVLEMMDLKLTTKHKTIRFVAIYRPPRSKTRIYPVGDFYDDMEKVVSYYKTVKDEVIFCGDFNVHVNKPEESETRKFMNIIESAGLKQHVTDKTHIKGNTLDLVITEDECSLIRDHVVADYLSDHAVVLLNLDVK